MTSIIEKITDFLDQYNLSDKTIIVGFSGGYDSMCLLDVLSKIKSLEGYDDLKIIAAHFNHNWRGNESLQEQEVCRLFASRCGFEFFTKTASGSVKKTEADARIARYEFFEEACEDYDADAVFTAHNKDDNAETILYRAIKGTGLYGLKGISVKRDCFYRPLLKTSRKEILEYCDNNCLTPNNDSSNSDITYRRNFIRLKIMPALEVINPSVKDSLNTLAEVAQSEDSIIEEYLANIRPNVFSGDSIIPSEYDKLSIPVQKRIIHEYLRSYDLDYDFKKITEMHEFVENNIHKKNGTTKSLTTSQWLYVDDKIIEIIPHKNDTLSQTDLLKDIVVSISDEGEYEFGNKIITLKKYVEKDIFIFPDSTANFVYVDLSNIKMPLTLRTRRDGDIINPFGMKGTMKLKKYLNSKGVQRHKRDEIPLITFGDEVLWVIGIGLSNKIGVTQLPSHVIEIKEKV